MKRIINLLFLCTMSVMIFAGCGKEDAISASTAEGQISTDTEMTGEEPLLETEAGESVQLPEDTMVIPGIFLKNDGDTWLFASDTRGLFTAPVPDDLTDASGAALDKNELVPGNHIDIYGNGIMLESYPGQYPGVTKMVVTAQGTEADVAPYQEEIDQFFPEPDLSSPPQLSISYSTSFASVTALLTGPGNYTWEEPSDNGESMAMVACGPHIIQWENLADITLEGKTNVQLEGNPMPDKITVLRYPVSVYMTENYDIQGEEVIVEADEDGHLFIADVEAGYIYGISAEWEMGQAEYGFLTKTIEK